MAIQHRKKSEGSEKSSTRTTLSIDNDVLLAVRQQAEIAGTSLGKTVSDMIRRSTVTPEDEPRFYNGVRLLPKRGSHVPVTTELVNELLNDVERETILTRGPASDKNDEMVVPLREDGPSVTSERVNSLRDDDL